MKSDQHIEEYIQQLLKDTRRRHALYFALSPDQEDNEIYVAWMVSQELKKRGEGSFDLIKPRGQGNDPPDCQAIDDDGRRIGVEVTEFVNGTAIAAAKEGNFILQDPPEVQSVVKMVSDIIRRKDRAIVCGGPYKKYILVIYCDDPDYLDYQVLETIRETKFGPTRLIDRAYFLESYSPYERGLPLIELQLS